MLDLFRSTCRRPFRRCSLSSQPYKAESPLAIDSVVESTLEGYDRSAKCPDPRKSKFVPAHVAVRFLLAQTFDLVRIRSSAGTWNEGVAKEARLHLSTADRIGDPLEVVAQ